MSRGRCFAALEQLDGRARAACSRSARAAAAARPMSTTPTRPTAWRRCCRRCARTSRGKLIVVFGAGGDRDKAKRPLMGEAAADLADVAIVTDDNPAHRRPRRHPRRGAGRGAGRAGDRRPPRGDPRGARRCCSDGDVLVVAGKGHEQGQIVGGVVHPFDDVAETAAGPGGSAMADPLWTSAEIARRRRRRRSAAAFAATGVSIDSRTVEPGDLFVALAGVRDGHEFVARRMSKGAAGALVTQAVDGPAVMVGDTLQGPGGPGRRGARAAPQAPGAARSPARSARPA